MKDAIFDTLKEFENAFPLNQKKYQNYALQFIHESNDAKDLVNDSFAKLWEKRGEISDSNIEAYFYTIIKNNCLNYLRQKAIRYRVHQQIQDTAYSLLQYDIASLESFDQNPIFSSEIREIMLEQLKKMPELSSKIFMDNRFSNLSYEDIAAKYDIPKFKVRNIIQSVLSCLRISLQDYLPIAVIATFAGALFFK